MSEQRKPKRLDDREVATLHEFIKAEAGVAADVVAADHLQAREDRKLLAAALRECLEAMARCPCVGFRRYTEASGAAEALLAEADPQ